MSDAIWTTLLVIFFLLDFTLTPIVIYLYAWRNIQAVTGQFETFGEFVEEIQRIHAENPPPMLPPF